MKKSIVRISVIAAVTVLVAAVVVLKLQTKGAEKKSAAPAEISAGPLELTDKTEFDALSSGGLPVIIDFGADWCAPCRELAPIIAALHTELAGKAIIRYVDVDKYPALAEGLPLKVIPTQILFDASGKPYTPDAALGMEFSLYGDEKTNAHRLTLHEGFLDREQLLALLDSMGMKR